MKRYALALDLRDDPNLIAEYEAYHQAIWPEIEQSILDSGIKRMEIYRLGTRLFMYVEADEHFTFEAKAKEDLNNPKVQEWEELMWKYQQALPIAKPGEKWILMQEIFRLQSND
ncbi:L-rhamnose mutarotase [Flagellimonas sp. 2504JD4-2]